METLCRSQLPRLRLRPGAPKLLITPIFPDFFRFFPVFPWTSGRVLWIPGVQTLKMGEKWGKMGKKWVKKIITGVEKTVLMHASAHLEPAAALDAGVARRRQALVRAAVDRGVTGAGAAAGRLVRGEGEAQLGPVRAAHHEALRRENALAPCVPNPRS